MKVQSALGFGNGGLGFGVMIIGGATAEILQGKSANSHIQSSGYKRIRGIFVRDLCWEFMRV